LAPTLGRVGSPLRREDAVFRRRIVGLDCANRRARRRQHAWRRSLNRRIRRARAAFVLDRSAQQLREPSRVVQCWLGSIRPRRHQSQLVERRVWSVTFNLSGSALNVVWGSPNDDNPLSSNYVSFYSGANGGGGLLGTVLASDLYSNFSGITNTTDPGYMISFAPGQFGSVVFGTGPSDFEFAVVGPSTFSVAGVPEPSTWAMMVLGFAGLCQ